MRAKVLIALFLIGSLASAQTEIRKKDYKIYKPAPTLYLYAPTGASGAIIDFNGDVLLTQTANTLTLSGGNLALGTGNITTTGTVSTGILGVTTLNATTANITTIAATTTSSGSVTITANDALSLSGAATTWNDLFFPSNQLKKVGQTDKPDDDLVKMELLFPEDTTEAVGMVVQMPHDWKEGSTIYPHVHWMRAAADSVDWKIRYKWYNIGGLEPGTWGTYTMSHNTQTRTTGAIHEMSIAPASAGISGSGKTMSSILIIKLYRRSDPYTGDARFVQFDIHYEKDGFGSRTISTK